MGKPTTAAGLQQGKEDGGAETKRLVLGASWGGEQKEGFSGTASLRHKE